MNIPYSLPQMLSTNIADHAYLFTDMETPGSCLHLSLDASYLQTGKISFKTLKNV